MFFNKNVPENGRGIGLSRTGEGQRLAAALHDGERRGLRCETRRAAARRFCAHDTPRFCTRRPEKLGKNSVNLLWPRHLARFTRKPGKKKLTNL